MRKRTNNGAGTPTDQEIYDVDPQRLAFVMTLGEIEPLVDRATGEAVEAANGSRVWTVSAGIPGCKLAGATGTAEVRLSIEAVSAPAVEPYTAVALAGPVRLTGTTRGERRERTGRLSLRCRGITPYDVSALDADAQASDVPGVPITLPGPLVCLAASEARNPYDGSPITDTAGNRLMRLQLSTHRTFTRTSDGTEFRRQESVLVDVPRAAWDRQRIPLLGRIELIDVRCDARVNEGNGRVIMALSAAGYRLAAPEAPSNGNGSTPSTPRRGRSEPALAGVGADAASEAEGS